MYIHIIHIDNKPQLIVQPKSVNVNIIYGNETVILQCNAFAALTYSWERNSGTIPNKAILQTEGDTILEIPNIRREDAGDYRCVAENNISTSESEYASVTVTGQIVNSS